MTHTDTPPTTSSKPDSIRQKPSNPEPLLASNLPPLSTIDRRLEKILLATSQDARLPSQLRQVLLRCSSLARIEASKPNPNLARIRKLAAIQAHACCMRGKLALRSKAVVLARALDLELAECERKRAIPSCGG